MNDAASTPLRVIEQLHARGDQIAAAEQALAKIMAPTRANPDCLEFRVFHDQGDPTVFTLYEHWRSLEANQAHARRDYMAGYIAAKDTIFATIDGDFVDEVVLTQE